MRKLSTLILDIKMDRRTDRETINQSSFTIFMVATKDNKTCTIETENYSNKD
jgi:hypothetical protein